jgi:alcohol dehydrogenase class IV
MIPDVAICDPSLSCELPPVLTAATGVDAISHCVETYCSPKFNPVAEAIALDGLQRAWRNLPTVVGNGGDIAARGEMLMAALQGGLTFQKGLGAIHSLSHPLGALKHRRLHHGMLNAVFLPHVLRFNADACPEKICRMAQATGVGADVDSFIRACSELIEALGLPTRLRDMGVAAEDLAGIPAAAVADHSTPTNPRPVTTGDCLMMLEAAF